MIEDERRRNSMKRTPPIKQPSPQELKHTNEMGYVYAAIACKPEKTEKDQWWTCVDRGYWVKFKD